VNEPKSQKETQSKFPLKDSDMSIRTNNHAQAHFK